MAGEIENLGQYGITGGPGRPKGARDSAKVRVLRLIDDMLADEENYKALRKKFEQMFDKNPAAFVMKILAPLAPKDVQISSPDDRSPVRITVTNGKRKSEGEEVEENSTG